MAIKNILIDYELASAQCTNFNKSGYFFSPNINVDFRDYLQVCLDIIGGANLGKYLGLPLSFSRNIGMNFSYLKEFFL